jgi:hypothetical protein
VPKKDCLTGEFPILVKRRRSRPSPRLRERRQREPSVKNRAVCNRSGKPSSTRAAHDEVGLRSMRFCRGKCIQLRLMAFLIFLSSSIVASAAKIDVISLGPNKPSLVTIDGLIESGDNDQFLRKIGPITNAIVAFNSDGGNLLAGIQIGELIRLRNFASLVPDGMRCASSCALAWLGGTKRLMASKAQIGFHAASDRETGKVTSVGNALVGAYLNKIGLPYSAVVYITSAAPEEISWLSKSDAEKLGIEVSFYRAADDPKVSAKTGSTGTPTKRPTSQQQSPCFGSDDCKDDQRPSCFGSEDCKDHPDYLAFGTPTNTASTKRPTSQQQSPCFGSEDCKGHPDYLAFGTPATRAPVRRSPPNPSK